MAETLSAEIQSSLTWLFQDSSGLTTIADASQLVYDAQLVDGGGDGQANMVWHDVRSVASAANDDLVLSALSQTIFGSTVTIDFTAIKALSIVNTETTDGADLILGAAPSAAWGAPFGATSHQVRVPADSCLLLVNKNPGWSVAATSSDTLRVGNPSSQSIGYKIVIIGVHA